MKSVVLVLFVALALVGCDKKSKPSTPQAAPQTAAQKKTEKPAEAANAKTETHGKTADQPAGQWVESKAYGVKFRVPKDWDTKHDGDSVSTTSPDQAITVLLVGTQSKGVIQAAVESIKKKLQFKDVKIKKDNATVLNGMPGYSAEGSAVLVEKSGDNEIQFFLNSVQVGSQGVALMIFADATMYEAKKEEVDGIAKTLQKI